jgi:hypothetical protein
MAAVLSAADFTDGLADPPLRLLPIVKVLLETAKPATSKR